MEFNGKTILVTGATTGIGRATALAFAQLGANVGVNYPGAPAEFDTMISEHPGLASKLLNCPGDVSQADDVTAMITRLIETTGRIDVLVNNAGISMIKPLLQTTEDDWDRVMDTDLKSVFLCSRAVVPHMLEKGGCIINIASELAYTGRAGFSAYTAAKGGIISFTRSLAREFAPGIRINAVAPGPTLTPLLEAEIQTPGHDESLDEIPLGRYATAAEIAHTIVFLASEKASYYCGEVLSPNGGTLMR